MPKAPYIPLAIVGVVIINGIPESRTAVGYSEPDRDGTLIDFVCPLM